MERSVLNRRWWLYLLFVTAIAFVLVPVWGEVSLHPGESGEAQWWYCGEHPEVCGAGCSFVPCYTSDHWSVELATYAQGDWAYVALDCARRFNIEDITAGTFDYTMIAPHGVQTDSGPSLGFALVDPVTGTEYLAISGGATPQSGPCTTFDALGAAQWWWGTCSSTPAPDETWDPSTIVLDPTAPGGAVAMQADLTGYEVQAVLVLMGVVGETVGSAGGNPIGTGQAVVDDVGLQWTSGGTNYGGTYYLEKGWDETVGFDDWTQAPLPGDEPPREWDKWCVEECEHCLDIDDQNLWTLIRESDLDGLSVPVEATTFPSPEYALYFGNPTTGNYDMGEASVGCVCSPYNELNPGDQYASLTFDYFREVEQYMGAYDWTYVQIWFDDWTLPVTWFDPFSIDNPGDTDTPPVACPQGSMNWKTIWYKDSSDPNEGDWTEAVITHYLDADNEAYADATHRITIPPQATRMRIRFCFNSMDGAENAYFGWLIDDIMKEHSSAPTGCRIITDYLPQAVIGEKYEFDLDPQVIPGSTTGARSWSITEVMKDGQRTSLPKRLALDPRGRLYGEPDPGTAGTYEISFLLECWSGRPDEKTLVLSIRPPSGGASVSLIGSEDFEGVSSAAWRVDGQPFGPTSPGCPNLWHETGHVKYALEDAPVKAEYGDVAYFGQDDDGTTTDPYDPNYRCSRAKGCLISPMYQITEDEWDGEELIVGFKSWRQVEYFVNGEYDRTWVDVRFEGGSWETVWERSSKDPSLATWAWQEIHTGLLLQKGVKIQLRFCFDSVDGYENGEDGKCFGWLIDEISLYAGGAVLSISNCPREETSIGDYYKEELRASGGSNIQPIWEIASGSLPPGLGLVPNQANRRIAYIEGVPRTVGTYLFTVRVRDADWDEVATRECRIVVGEEVTLLFENFEDDPFWSQGGLWHFTTDGGVAGVDDLGAANHAAYYGQDDQGTPNYDTGSRTSGMLTLVLPAVDLTGVEAVRISFDYWREVESFSGEYDVTKVQVQLDSGDWSTIWEKSGADPSLADWMTEDGIPPFLTNGAETMKIRFVFDSMDKWYNDYVGWLVDNVRVEKTAPGGAGPLSALKARTHAVRPRDLADRITVSNIPNPVRDVHTTTFLVRNVDVEAIRIQIFDLNETLVYEEEVPGNELVWHTENDYGEYLANGVYFYRAQVKIGSTWITTEFQKLVILR